MDWHSRFMVHIVPGVRWGALEDATHEVAWQTAEGAQSVSALHASVLLIGANGWHTPRFGGRSTVPDGADSGALTGVDDATGALDGSGSAVAGVDAGGTALIVVVGAAVTGAGAEEQWAANGAHTAAASSRDQRFGCMVVTP
jgi:hypothetical protein